MAIKVNSKAILDKLAKAKGDRTKISLYLSKDLYEKFQKKCGKVSASQVMEELMRQFVAS